MVFQRGVEQVDVHHAALGAGLFGGVQHLDVVPNAKRPRGEDEQRAEQVGQHAPGREKRHGAHGGEPGERRPQHRGRDAQRSSTSSSALAMMSPADQPVDGHQQFPGNW
jgi:hypothetical protein